MTKTTHNHSNRSFTRPVSTAAAIALALPASALAQVDTSDWKCEYCPFPDGYEAEVGVGASNVSDDSARIGSANGYDESGVYADVDGGGLYAADAYRLSWMADDLGLDSRRLEVEGGKPGAFGFTLGYRELPYRLFRTTQTVFTASGNDELTLPSGWVSSANTQNMTGLSAALTGRDIASDREILDLGFDVDAISNVTFFADYQRQQRDGVQIMGGSSFFQAALLPRVIDYETELVDAGLRYARGPLSLSAAWFGSFFTNNADSLTWDNPFGVFNDQGRLALEPDNDFQQVSVSGTYVADSLNSVIAFTVATGQGEQDDDLLAYTLNSAIAAPGLPRPTAAAEVDTTHYALSITSRPLPKTRVRFSYRYDERDNTTPQAFWQRVVVDGFLAPGAEQNIPYSYERSTIELDASYRVSDTVRLGAGYERKDIDRDFQEVAEQTEDTGYGKVRWLPIAEIELQLKGGTARREPKQYNDAFAALNNQNPLLRKYHLAYRYRGFAESMLTYTPSALPVSATMTAMYSNDSYSRSQLGLLDSDSKALALDVSWTPTEFVSAYVHASDEVIEARQAGSSLFAAPNWFATHDDDFETLGGGVRFRNIGERVDMRVDYTRATGETEIIVDPPSGANSEFPALESKYYDLRVAADFRSSAKLTWNVELRYQRFETEDWAIEGLGPDTARSLLALGASPYDEDVIAIAFGVRYRIGADDE